MVGESDIERWNKIAEKLAEEQRMETRLPQSTTWEEKILNARNEVISKDKKLNVLLYEAIREGISLLDLAHLLNCSPEEVVGRAFYRTVGMPSASLKTPYRELRGRA
jgi:hypothetical protein